MGESREFTTSGVHHLALVCEDMARTVAFYRDLLGFPLVKTIALPDGSQHFFFDIGAGNTLAFFWFKKKREAIAGVSSPKYLPGEGNFTTASGSMNHVALTVPADKIEQYRDLLVGKGVAVTPIMNHDDSPAQMSKTNHPGVWLRSVYFWDPDGVLLEFAAWTRDLGTGDAAHDPVDANGVPVPMVSGQASLA
jgi:catechol 2,3-dioxygenase-like lactoylglutathione lyase family enzyme